MWEEVAWRAGEPPAPKAEGPPKPGEATGPPKAGEDWAGEAPPKAEVGWPGERAPKAGEGWAGERAGPPKGWERGVGEGERPKVGLMAPLGVCVCGWAGGGAKKLGGVACWAS